MGRKPRIQINEHQLEQIKEIQERNDFGAYSQVLDLLLKNQKRYEDLENIVRSVHMRTKL